jgi:uncharacterized protein YjbI with pentapeptide repeats
MACLSAGLAAAPARCRERAFSLSFPEFMFHRGRGMSDETAPEETGAAAERHTEAVTLARSYSTGTGFLMFVLGLLVGFPLAIAGAGYLAAKADLLAALIFAALIVIAGIGALIALNRRRIWEALFRVSEVQLQHFAGPLADAARHVAAKHPNEAADAARRFVELALARWTWIATRRWILASITALIAATAALAGSALLFRQNELIAQQTVRLDEQTRLLIAQTELADAARAAALIPEISRIADGLEELPIDPALGRSPISDAGDLPDGLQARIVAATFAARPYRVIDRSREDPLQEAARGRPDLPALAEQFAERPPPSSATRLTEQVSSPERGQILRLLLFSGIIKTAALSLQGADFSYAVLGDLTLALPSLRHAKLEYADFSGATIVSGDFGGALVNRASFQSAILRNTVFSTLSGDEAEEPFKKSTEPYPTLAGGADFSQAVIVASPFERTRAGFARFDGALVHKTSFRGALLAGATFRGAVLLDNDFTGADLRSVDFDGAIVIGANWLERLAAGAAPDTFRADRYRIDPVAEPEVREIDIVYLHLGVEVPDTALAGKPAFRVVRIKPFE